MAKLLISVLYLSATMVAIFLLVASTGVTAKTKMDVCPAIRMGTVKSPQACTNMCKKKFGSLYYDSLCKSIKTKRPSSLYDVEEFKWSNLLCGCLKKKKGSCSSDIDSELDGAQSCSSFASSTASSGHSSPSSGHSSPSSGSSAACSHAPSRSSSGRSSASSGSSSRRSGSSS